MEPICLEVHPLYGAIYREGEFVQRGAVLGLTREMDAVVVAPFSGWVLLVEPVHRVEGQNPTSFRIELHPQNALTGSC